MKHHTKFYIFLSVLFILSLVAALFGSLYTFSSRQELRASQKRIEARLDQLEIQSTEPQGSDALLSSDMSNLLDEVSIEISIIGVGIALFALFGGVLSIFNVLESHKIDTAIVQAESALENQNELIAARKIQEGRMYTMRNRNDYANTCFYQAMKVAPESVCAYIARYEQCMLHVDAHPDCKDEVSEKRVQVYNKLLEDLHKKPHTEEYNIITADVYSLLGCIYGQYSLACSTEEEKQDALKKSKEYLEEANIRQPANIDTCRSLANTYALLNDQERCKKTLWLATTLGESSLDAQLIKPERLKKLFEPTKDELKPEMIACLKEEFSIDLTD